MEGSEAFAMNNIPELDMGEFDAVMVGELDRITKPLRSLADIQVFEGVINDISALMTANYGDMATVGAVRRRLRNLCSRFNKFMHFISTPGVSFNYTTNKISLATRYLHRFRRMVSNNYITVLFKYAVVVN